MFPGWILAWMIPLSHALPEPLALIQEAFVVLPSCYFTWGNHFIGLGQEVGTTGLVYTDASLICRQYTRSGTTGVMVPAINSATQIFPMLQMCVDPNSLVGWVSQTVVGLCSILTGNSLSADMGTLVPVPCTTRISAVFCYYPFVSTSYLNTSTFTVTTISTLVSTILVPSFTSTTVTALTTTPTTTVQTDFSTSNTFIITVATSISSIAVTSRTTVSTSVQTTLTISETILITTTLTYHDLSVSVVVPTITETELFTTTQSVCD